MVKLWIATRTKTSSSFVYHLTTIGLNNNGQSHQVVEREENHYLPKGYIQCVTFCYLSNESSLFQHIIKVNQCY